LQDSQLVRDTLRENVRLGVPDASDEQIWQALEHAYVADEIRELPNGLDTVFGEGIDLSGGQMQRIAIARALLMDTPILIMDEAMSAADPGSEAEIQRALSHLVEGRTVLVIAHRPESVFGAQQILRLDGGRIAERIQGEAVTDDAVRKMMHVRNDR
ncbi:MAG: ATP-binding cassette domain-containing protein, partial [Ancrocorticia sp.]